MHLKLSNSRGESRGESPLWVREAADKISDSLHSFSLLANWDFRGFVQLSLVEINSKSFDVVAIEFKPDVVCNVRIRAKMPHCIGECRSELSFRDIVQLSPIFNIVVPAKAGIQRRKSETSLDPCIRRDDTIMG
jgi:hypothetical protein